MVSHSLLRGFSEAYDYLFFKITPSYLPNFELLCLVLIFPLLLFPPNRPPPLPPPPLFLPCAAAPPFFFASIDRGGFVFRAPPLLVEKPLSSPPLFF